MSIDSDCEQTLVTEVLISEQPSARINNEAESTVPLTQAQKELELSFKKAVTKAYKKSAGSRVLGKSYIGFQRSSKDDNNVYRVGRNQRKMSPTRCSHTSLTMKTERSFMCGTFTEKDREKAFSRFWEIPSWNEKKGFVRGLVSSSKIKRRRNSTKLVNVKKNEGHTIFMKNKKGEKVRVCRKFFLKTLNLGEDMFRTWIRDESLQNDSTYRLVYQKSDELLPHGSS